MLRRLVNLQQSTKMRVQTSFSIVHKPPRYFIHIFGSRFFIIVYG